MPISFLSFSSAYCSEECQSRDLNSPCISSSSSAFSSPHLDYAVGGEVPPLVPEALGSALRKYQHHYGHHSVSSSSASSTSWSVVTDEEDEDGAFIVGSDRDSADFLHDGTSKSPSIYLNPRSRLSYARRPSGMNNRSTVPHLHRRTSSGSSSGHVGGDARSVPNTFSHTSAEDDDSQSDFGFDDEPSLESSFMPAQSAPDYRYTGTEKEKQFQHNTITSKTKRSRNRASLPAYFSLLQMPSSSSDAAHRASLSSSGKTIAATRPSPPTPKLSLAGLTISGSTSLTAPPTPSAHATPRGRRRGTGGMVESLSSSKNRYSSSRSHSRTRERQATLTNKLPPAVDDDSTPLILPRSRFGSKNSAETVFDWSSVPGLPPPARGRTSIRRNSSPPPKMMLSLMSLGVGLERSTSPTRVPAPRGAGVAASPNGSRTGRGRARVEELDGLGSGDEAPGYGNGRSGLLDRERANRKAGRFRS